MLDNLNEPKSNVLLTVLSVMASTLLLYFAPIMKTVGMAFIAIIWFPFAIGLGTIGIYYMSRMAFRKYNWVITVLGIAYMFFYALSSYFDKVG